MASDDDSGEENMPSPLEINKRKRASTKGLVTKLIQEISQLGNTYDEIELDDRLEQLHQYVERFERLQDEIETLDPEEIEGDERETFGKRCGELRVRLRKLKAARQRNVDDVLNATMVGNSSGAAATVRVELSDLPKVDVPEFSGSYTEWLHFWNSFSSLVDNNTKIDDVVKFHHLRRALKGHAADVIAALDLTAANYKKAKELLAERYQNNRLIFQDHIAGIFQLACMSQNTPDELLRLINRIDGHLDSLRQIGNSQQILDCFLIHLILGKLVEDLQLRWERKAPAKDIPTWQCFSKFLVGECTSMEHHESVRRHFRAFADVYGKGEAKRQPPSKLQSGKRATALAAGSAASSPRACVVCKASGHGIYSCPTFKQLGVPQRYEKVKALQLCINCLAGGHLRKDCRAGNCRVCNARHHTILHGESDSSTTTASPAVAAPPLSASNDTSGTSSVAVASVTATPASDSSISVQRPQAVLLATALVEIRDRDGAFVPARALLDTGSQATFVTERLASILGLPRGRVDVRVNGIGGRSTRVKHKVTMILRSRVERFECETEALVIPKIVERQPSCPVDTKAFDIPSNLVLADPNYGSPDRIDVLIGSEIFFQIVAEGKLWLGERFPMLQRTLLGWVVVGNAPEQQTSAVSCMKVEVEEQHEPLFDLVKNFWTIEEPASPTRHFSPEEQECEAHFRRNVQQEPDGRFSVLLPFREPPSELGDSYASTVNRFISLERRFRREPELAGDYKAAIYEFLEKGFAEFIDPAAVPGVNYLAQLAAVKTDSSTYKVRPVFDASNPTRSGKSLNDILCVGPVLQDDLFTIILRARRFHYLHIADIAKMYLQVVVREPDCNLQCILWRNASSDPFKVIRINRVTFGTAPASYLAVRCLHELARRFEEQFPVGAQVVTRDFYVDNMFSGADSIEELIRIRDETTPLLALGQFPLRKWATNSAELLDQIPDSERETLLRLDDAQYLKTLGLVWIPEGDWLTFKYQIDREPQVVTRRVVLSLLARIYDLLGLINPVVTHGKMLLQRTWDVELGWDDPLPSEMAYDWISFLAQLPLLQKLKLPRFLLSLDRPRIIRLHGFCDASERAYGAVIYLASTSNSGETVVQLACAKSKVAPRKTTTLARLELCAMVLLGDLLQRALNALADFTPEVHLWSDSTVALAWIRRPPSAWSTFVANRVARVQHQCKGAVWRHVPGVLNPADLCSRGLLPQQLLEAEIWFHGPSFLAKGPSCWPDSDIPPTAIESHPLVAALAVQQPPDLVEKWCNECSRRLFRDLFVDSRRAVALALRWTIKKAQRPSGSLSADELLKAEGLMVRAIQRKAFAEVFRALGDGKPLPVKSRLRQLTPFLGEDGLIRVGGRLRNADLPYDSRHPILLPSKHPFVSALARHQHQQNMHVGPNALLALLRSKYWILRGRDVVRRVVHTCRPCQRTNPKLASQLMGDLPRERVRMAEPFEFCGVDLFGPIFIHYGKIRGRKATKAYAALFICRATKAVHIELVRDLSSEAFLRALDRFCARRGRPVQILSDNATNFVGANRYLQETRELFNSVAFQDKLFNRCADMGVEWKFIPPRSPHFGGLWENAIKQAKSLLRRTCAAASYTEDELETILSDAEAVMNSRPIVPLSNDPNDYQALAPFQAWSRRSLKALPQPQLGQPEDKVNRLSRYQRVLWAQQQFWRQWSQTYLQELQSRAKWFVAQPNLQKGDLVLIRSANTPPRGWPLARVVETHLGRDGRVRVVTLRTPTGEFKRAISKVAPLHDEDSDLANVEGETKVSEVPTGQEESLGGES